MFLVDYVSEDSTVRFVRGLDKRFEHLTAFAEGIHGASKVTSDIAQVLRVRMILPFKLCGGVVR